MNLLLSPVVFSNATLQGKPLPTSPAEHSSAKLVPRPLRTSTIFLYLACINFGKCQNLYKLLLAR